MDSTRHREKNRPAGPKPGEAQDMPDIHGMISGEVAEIGCRINLVGLPTFDGVAVGIGALRDVRRDSRWRSQGLRFCGVQGDQRLAVRPFQIVVKPARSRTHPCLRPTQALADLKLRQPGGAYLDDKVFPVHDLLSAFCWLASTAFLFNYLSQCWKAGFFSAYLLETC